METVLAATIGAIATVCVAAIPIVVVNRRVGKPNGHGNVVEMLTQVLAKVGDLDLRHGHLHDCLHKKHQEHATRLDSLESSLAAVAHDTRNVQQAVMNLQEPGSGDRWRLRHGREDPQG